MPFLSIIIPLYNSELTIGRTLDSIITLPIQSRQQSEVIIIDDGSRDRSGMLAESYRDRLAPASLLIISQENQGTSVARNSGIAQSRGNWVFFLDADDELDGDLIPSLRLHPDASAIAFSVKYFRNGKRQGRLRPPRIDAVNHLDLFSAGNALAISSVAVKRELIRVSFDPHMRFLEDWLFWIMNPQVFNNLVVLRHMFSARIHAHGSGKTSEYEKTGEYRELIAEEVLRNLQGKLTRKQKNNFIIHMRIGRLLRGERPSGSAFRCFPCSATLYSKLLLYTLLRNKLGRFDKYGKRP